MEPRTTFFTPTQTTYTTIPRFYIRSDGTLEVGAPNYETLVTADDDIPNKKYVDDNDFWTRTGTTLNPETTTDSVEWDEFKHSTAATGGIENLFSAGAGDHLV